MSRNISPAITPRGWQAELARAYTDPRALLAALDLPADYAPSAGAEWLARFPLRVPRGFVARMRPGDPGDPLLRQVLPLDAEGRAVPGFGSDPVGERSRAAGAGLLRKYAGRALLVATGACAVHCRYCFRREFPYAEQRAGHADAVRAALRAAPDVDELILSGGDPLTLSDRRLGALLRAAEAEPSIHRVRIHTRVPVVLPERVDAGLRSTLAAFDKPLVVVLHANHANELDAAVAGAAADLRALSRSLLNQAVLLRGVNDSVDALAGLSERLFDVGVLPYYLHQLDPVSGAAHFEVDDASARRLASAVAARLPGYLVPRLVREVSGDAAKRPLTPAPPGT